MTKRKRLKIKELVAKSTHADPESRHDTIFDLKKDFNTIFEKKFFQNYNFKIIVFLIIVILLFIGYLSGVHNAFGKWLNRGSRGTIIVDAPKVSISDSLNKIFSSEKYFCLFIANNRYQYWSPLMHPKSDAKKIMKVLVDKYSFIDENITFVEDAERETIISYFDMMVEKIKNDENLLIFFGGHGYFDEKLSMGYWIPVDGQLDRRSNWISNSSIKEYTNAIQSKHTLIISDACFSGSLLSHRDKPEKNISAYHLYKKPSRRAMSSGNDDEIVPDKSIFAEQLFNVLDTNSREFISSSALFHSFHNQVISLTHKTPQYGSIPVTSHQGGDFIFFKMLDKKE